MERTESELKMGKREIGSNGRVWSSHDAHAPTSAFESYVRGLFGVREDAESRPLGSLETLREQQPVGPEVAPCEWCGQAPVSGTTCALTTLRGES